MTDPHEKKARELAGRCSDDCPHLQRAREERDRLRDLLQREREGSLEVCRIGNASAQAATVATFENARLQRRVAELEAALERIAGTQETDCLGDARSIARAALAKIGEVEP